MPPMQGSFDASQFAPKQIGDSHPIGKFPFQITAANIQATKDNTGGMYVVEFTSPSGVAFMRYNLWNQSAKAVEIAYGQLSALCHATGVFRLNWQDEGAAMKGARGMMDIGYQKGQEPSAENPSGGYTEIKKVYDVHGNEPGKAPAPTATLTQGQQPMQQQPGGGWGSQPQGQQLNPPGGQQGWGSSAPAAAAAAPAAPATPAGGGWQQNQGAQQPPPWAK